MDWRHLFISPQATLKDALQAIDAGAVQLAIVVDDGAVLGVVSDGDVRRALLKGMELAAPVFSIMNVSPVTIRQAQPAQDALRLMRKNELRQVLVVNDRNQFVNLLTLHDLAKLRVLPNPVVLMAGGLGARLGDLTRDCPKPLLRVGGKPILEIIIDNFINEGFHDFYVSLNYRAEMIREYFGDGSSKGISLTYLCEEKPLGTAGALSLLPPLEHPCVVMNGDILTRLSPRDFLEYHVSEGSLATMAIKPYEMQVPYGVIISDTENRIARVEEKPVRHFAVSAGVYALSPKAVQAIPNNTFFDMPRLFNMLIEAGDKPAVFEIDDYWIDIGHTADYHKANEDFKIRY